MMGQALVSRVFSFVYSSRHQVTLESEDLTIQRSDRNPETQIERALDELSQRERINAAAAHADPAPGSDPGDADRARAGRAGPARGHQYRGDPGAGRALLSGVPRPLHHGDPGPGVPAVLTARAPGGGQ